MAEKEQLSEALERLERDIDKEVAKLKHYMEPADKLIENNDWLLRDEDCRKTRDSNNQ